MKANGCLKNPALLFLNDMPSSSACLFNTGFSPQEWKLISLMVGDAIYPTPSMKICGLSVVDICANGEDYERREPTKVEVLKYRAQTLTDIQTISPINIVFCGEIVEHYYRKEFPNALRIQAISLLMDFGMENSVWYKTNVRSLAEYIKEERLIK